LETIADIQLQIQNLVKLANIANNQLADIKTTLLQIGETHKTQIGEDIYLLMNWITAEAKEMNKLKNTLK